MKWDIGNKTQEAVIIDWCDKLRLIIIGLINIEAGWYDIED